MSFVISTGSINGDPVDIVPKEVNQVGLLEKKLQQCVQDLGSELSVARVQEISSQFAKAQGILTQLEETVKLSDRCPVLWRPSEQTLERIRRGISVCTSLLIQNRDRLKSALCGATQRSVDYWMALRYHR